MKNQSLFVRLFLLCGFAAILGACANSRNELLASAQTNNRNSKRNSNSQIEPANNRNQIAAKSATNVATELSPPKIVSRAEWQAKKAVGEMKAHKISAVTVHHTATAQKPDATIARKMQNLQNYAQNEAKLADNRQKPVWADVPYHFYIAADGQIAEGREIEFVGDTNTDYDPNGHALVVLEGNFEVEKPTAAQLKSLEQIVFRLGAEWKIRAETIKAHNDHAATACPGANLKEHLEALREKYSAARK